MFIDPMGPGENTKKTSSRLVIAAVRGTDSGNYTCSTTHAEPSTISVYVSQGKGGVQQNVDNIHDP